MRAALFSPVVSGAPGEGEGGGDAHRVPDEPQRDDDGLLPARLPAQVRVLRRQGVLPAHRPRGRGLPRRQLPLPRLQGDRRQPGGERTPPRQAFGAPVFLGVKALGSWRFPRPPNPLRQREGRILRVFSHPLFGGGGRIFVSGFFHPQAVVTARTNSEVPT